ncbi:hypothetical protein AS034_13485 [[Bacillus] enclensis]|nr:hypothetical protein AS034_13485 [[Bacillus] enclensis]
MMEAVIMMKGIINMRKDIVFNRKDCVLLNHKRKYASASRIEEIRHEGHNYFFIRYNNPMKGRIM